MRLTARKLQELKWKYPNKPALHCAIMRMNLSYGTAMNNYRKQVLALVKRYEAEK